MRPAVSASDAQEAVRVLERNRARLAAAFARPGWRFVYVTAAKLNLARWNRLAAGDREDVIDCVGQIARAMSARYAH